MARSTFLQAVISELTEAKSKGMSVNDQNTKGNNNTDTTYYIDNSGPAPKVATKLHKGKVGKKIAKETIKKIFDSMEAALTNKIALYEMVSNEEGIKRTRQQLMEFHGMRRSMEDDNRMSNMRFQIPDELKGRVRDNGQSRMDFDGREDEYDEDEDYDDYGDLDQDGIDDEYGSEQQFSSNDARDSNDLDQDGIDDDMETEDHDDLQIVQGHSDQELSVDASSVQDVDAPEEDIDVGTVINNVLEKLRNDHTLTVRDAFLNVLNGDAGESDDDVTMNFGDDLAQPETADDGSDEFGEDDEIGDADDYMMDDEEQMSSEQSDYDDLDDDYSADVDYRDDSYRPNGNSSRPSSYEDEYQDDDQFNDDDYEQHDANYPPTRRRMYETSTGKRNYAVGYKNGTVTSREQVWYVKADNANQAVGKVNKVLKENGIVAYNINVRDVSLNEISNVFETDEQLSSFDCNGCSVQKLRDINHAQMVCKGTSWNICNNHTFDRANDEGPLYVVLKQGKPMFLLQPSTQKFVDARNKDIDPSVAHKLLNLR